MIENIVETHTKYYDDTIPIRLSNYT